MKTSTTRTQRRKFMRLAYQVLAAARRLNKRYNDGHTSHAVVKIVQKSRGLKMAKFAPVLHAAGAA